VKSRLSGAAFAFAVLEAEVEDAARLEAGPQAGEGGGQVGLGDMQQAGTGPDAVVAAALLDVFEAA
jgi:hypothetical protein